MNIVEVNRQPAGFIARIGQWASFVRFSHTVFALPFALSIAVFLSSQIQISFKQMALILLCLVSARTAAMGFNRILDRSMDARNPRTKQRELPTGAISWREAVLLTIVSAALFIIGAAGLGALCLFLSPLVLLVLLGYSYTKRFTSFSHVVLGLALALAPGGVWIALTGHFSTLPIWMMIGVILWVAGFDILYSCQDIEFDRNEKLFSIPAAVGSERAFQLSRLLHVGAVLMLAGFGLNAGMGAAYYLGLGLFSALLVSQHRIISPSDLSRIDQAFFTRNGLASVVYFCGVLLDRFL